MTQVPGVMPMSQEPSLPPLTPSPPTSVLPHEQEDLRTLTAPPQPQALPPPPAKGKAKAKEPQEPMHKSECIPKPTYKITGIFTEEETSGHDQEEEPLLTLSEAACRYYHPDYAGHSAYVADLNFSEYTYLAQGEELLEATVNKAQDNPKTLSKVQSHTDWLKWQKVMDREIATLEEASTWTTVPRLANKNIIGSKWVFCIKCKANGTIEKYKVHLVACGFTQKFGVDYFDTFSPVARLASFCIILTIAAHNDWDIDTFDFNSTYLNSKLSKDEDIYMQAPPRYDTQGESIKHLLKSLYSLKQAGRKWYNTLCHALTDLGFCVNDANPRVFSACNGTSARTQVTARLFTGAQQESSASCTSSQVKCRVII